MNLVKHNKSVSWVITTLIIILSILYLSVIILSNYNEQAKLNYRYERIALELSRNQYIEFFAPNDYVVNDKNQIISDSSYQFKESTLLEAGIFNIAYQYREVAEKDSITITTAFRRVRENHFEFSREYKFEESILNRKSSEVYFQLLYSNALEFEKKRTMFKSESCNIKVINLDEYNFKVSEGLILIKLPLHNKSSIKVELDFIVNCSKDNRFVLYKFLSSKI